MKRSILWMRKILPLTLIVFVLSIVIASVGTTSPISITQTNPVTTVYLSPPTITGVTIGEEFTVNLMIRDSPDIMAWQAGLIFDPDILNCTGFHEGEFLSDEGPTEWIKPAEPPFNNTLGIIYTHGCYIMLPSPGEEMVYASGDGRLAYVTFKVIAPGVSDLHLKDVKPTSWEYVDSTAEKVKIPTNIIDVYTVFVNATTSHTVVTMSNSTGTDRIEINGKMVNIYSGLYDHFFNLTLKEISFKVTGPYPGFSEVTIPQALLSPESPRVWGVIINGTARIIESPTENATHTTLYFTYPLGLNDIHVTTRFMSSIISIALSEDSISPGSSVTISGNVTAADETVREDVNVTIQYRIEGDAEWGTLATVKTNSNGIYSYDWEPDETGTYEVKARWNGDVYTLGDESDVRTLKVKGAAGIPLEIVMAVVVVVIVIAAAVVVYFVKFR